jgi:hypothetical protein
VQDLHPADALLPALVAWDASAGAHQDATLLDAVGPRPQLADGAEKSAGRELDAQARDAVYWRWELRAAPAAELAAEEPCTLGAVRFAERSCVGPEVVERQDAAQSELPKARSPKLPEEVWLRMESAQLQAASPDAPAHWLVA